MISAEDGTESKPAPDVFEAVLKKLQIQGEEVVAIGDAPYTPAALFLLFRNVILAG